MTLALKPRIPHHADVQNDRADRGSKAMSSAACTALFHERLQRVVDERESKGPASGGIQAPGWGSKGGWADTRWEERSMTLEMFHLRQVCISLHVRNSKSEA